MKHHKTGRKFGRVRKVRTSLMRSLLRSLILNGRIETTIAKARELRPAVEKMVTIAKNDTLANRRLVVSRLGNDNESTQKLFGDIAPKYTDRNGGYTRITKLGVIVDPMRDKAVIEFV